MMTALSQNAMFDFLNERISACQMQQKLLQNESREDEASFEKIRANIYEIFKTMLSTAIKKSGENAYEVKTFFLSKLNEIPSNWAAAYEKAAEHDDAEKMHIEKIKLDAAEDIKAAYRRIWEKAE